MMGRSRARKNLPGVVMETIIIVIHLMVVLALVGVVLLQRSEGGGLGIGGGSGFMTARGAANALTRATAILAVAFFATSLTLSIIARYQDRPIDILEHADLRRLPERRGRRSGSAWRFGHSHARCADHRSGRPPATAAPAAAAAGCSCCAFGSYAARH